MPAGESSAVNTIGKLLLEHNGNSSAMKSKFLYIIVLSGKGKYI
jgi:hypothetical protein